MSAFISEAQQSSLGEFSPVIFRSFSGFGWQRILFNVLCFLPCVLFPVNITK